MVAVTGEAWVVYCIMVAWETCGASSRFVGSGRKKVELIIWEWSCLSENLIDHDRADVSRVKRKLV